MYPHKKLREIYRRKSMKKLIGSISVALTLALSVFGLAACDLVNFNWGTGSDHEHHFTEYEATDPTCTKNGNYRYFKCDVGPDPCGRYYLDLAAMEPVSEESVMIPALGHEYDFDNIVWSEWNGKEITASVTCMQCDEEEPGHVLHPEITVEFTQTKAPTCTAKGEGYYTASFTYEGETYTNPTTKTAEVDMIPHTYNKVPDDGWKWADDHTSVSATFTCTAADCTHKETVTVSGAAITSKVETIKGVCTDGSQTVYTATAEFNGETYDLTDTVVTLEAINEHTAGAWQYDTENHWHKCQNGDHAADEKQPHKVDSATHQCECGYVEESYTVTALTLAANAENTAAILTISGTYTGYDQQGLTELFCEKNTDGNYFFNFWGNRIGRENAKSVTLTKWENGEFSVALDVTDLPVCELRNICRTDFGDQDWKLSTETIEETTITVGEKVYTLQPSNGQGWNNIGLKVASKPDEKSYTITKMTIAADEGAQKVYLTISGTFAGYDEEGIKELLNSVKNGNKFFYFYENSAGAEAGESYDVSTSGSEWFVKIDVTKLGPSEYRNICCTGIDGGDMKPDNFPGVVVENTLTVGEKIYTLGNNLWGNIGLTIKAKQIEVDGTFDLTTVTLEVDETAVYVVYKGTHTCKDTAALQAKFEAEAFGIWVGKLIPEANRTVTVEATTWTIKANVSSMNLADGTHFIYFNGGSGAGDINTFPLEAIPNITKTFGEKDYSIENHYGGGRDDFWGCVILRIAPTKEVSTYDFTDVTIEKTDSAVYFVASGSHNYTDTEQLKTLLGNIKFAFGGKDDNTGLEKQIEVAEKTWSIKFNVTELAAQANPYYFHFFYSTDPEGDIRLKNEHAQDGASVELAGKKYSIVNKGNGVNTGANETFWGCVCLKVETAKTAEFDIANLILFGGNQARVHIAIKSYTGFTEADLAKENVRLYVGEGEAIEPNEASVSSSRADYYFLVTGSSTGTLKLKIGDVELTNIASGVADVNTAFVNPNFYTLALNGDDLVLTVINNDCFTISSIEMQLAREGAAANLVLKGTYTTVTQAQAELYLKNVICLYGKEAATNAHKSVDVNGSDWTVTIRVSEFITSGEETLVYGGGGSDIHFTLGENTEVTLTSGEQKDLKYALVKANVDSVHLTVTNALKSISYNKISVAANDGNACLVIEGVFDGYSTEEVENILKNSTEANLPFKFSIYIGGHQYPAYVKSEIQAATWKAYYDLTELAERMAAQNLNHLCKNGDGSDIKNTDFDGVTFDDTVITVGNYQYSIVLDGDILSLKVVDATQPSYEITSGSVELEGGKAYFSVNGTYKNYEEADLRELLEGINLWFNRTSDWKAIGEGKDAFPGDGVTVQVSVNKDAGTWRVYVDVTAFDVGTWIAKFEGNQTDQPDIKLAGSKDGQTVEVGDKTYSIFNKYPTGDADLAWGCTCLKVVEKIALKDGEINFGREDPVAISNPDHMFYWNGDTEGTNATVTTKTAVDGVYTFQYTLTETAKGNAGLWYAVQLFYKNSELKENTVYTLTFQLKSSVTGKITVNGTVIDLTGSNQVQAVSVEYTQTAKASLSIQFGVDGNAPLEGGTFVISELKWQEKTSGPVDPEVPEITVSDIYNAQLQDKGILELFIICDGIGEDVTKAAEAFKLLIGDKEVSATEGGVTHAGNYFMLHYNLAEQNLEANTYVVKVRVYGKTTSERNVRMVAGNTTYADTEANKTYSIEIADGHLQLTVSTKVEVNLTQAYNASLETNDGKLTVYIQGSGIADENAAKDTFTLLVGEREIAIANVSDVTKGDVYFILRFDFTSLNLDVNVYNNVVIKYGEETQAIDSVTSTLTWTDSANEKTYTIAIVDGNLQLTVAAVAPAADGSQDAPFSVSDLAAIFEDGNSFNEEGYYTKDGEPQEVYVKGMVKSYDAASKQVTLQQIETRGGVLTVALSASELKIVIGEGTYNGSSTEGMTFVVGDVLTVKGYLQKGEDTLTVTGKDGATSPTIEVWESANKENPSLDAEADKAAIKTFFTELAEQVKSMEELTKEFALPLPTRPGVTFEFKVTAGDAAAAIEGGKLKVTRGAEEVTVKIEATIKVAGAKSDFTVDGSPFTFTVPQTKPATVDVTFTASEHSSANLTQKIALDDNIDLQFSKADGSSPPAYYSSGNQVSGAAIRCYANNTITVSGKDGATILSVTIVFGVKKTDPAPLTETTTKQTVSSGTAFQVGEEGVGASSIEFQVSNVSKQQVHIASIKVTYKPGKTLSPDEKIDAALKEINIEKTEFNDDFVLPTTIVSGVTLTWSVEGGDGVAAKIDETNTKLLIVPQAAEVTFTLVVEASCNGGTPVSKKFENLKVSAKTAVKTYTLVTSEEDLEVGAKIVFVYDIYACGTFTKGATGSGPLTALDGVTLDNKELTSLPDETVVWTVGGEKNAWTFTCTINSIEYRLAQGSTSNATMKGETGSVTTASQWTITFNNDSSAEIRNNKNYSSSAKWVFQCNIVKNQQRWGTYKDTQKDPFIYLVNE